jgi:hypothetical protein
MRKLIFGIVLSLGCGSLFAYNGSNMNRYSDLNIKMWDNSSFNITLDRGISHKTRSFNLKNVSPGDHYVKIVKRKQNRSGHGGFVQTIYEGRINIPSKRRVLVKVEGRNRLSFRFLKKANSHHHNTGHGNGHQNAHSNNGHQNQNATGGVYGPENYSNNWDSGCESTTNDGGHYRQSNFGNNGFENNYGPSAMNQISFNRLLEVLKREHFDSDRLGIAKQAIASNHMNVNQVSAIMDGFYFDQSKLNFAKAAYNKTVDKENYFAVNEQFSFSSSISALNNYIRHNA